MILTPDFGGSWADDDIDLSSISVPIERHRHYEPHDYSRRQAGDMGPPYIVKLLNLPVTCDDAFVEDLFRSRYTPYVKFKIVVDPVNGPLDLGVVKRVAFVELALFQEYSKVLKWLDLFYKGGRRVFVEPADFGDFQNCMKFNQDHDPELARLIDDYASGRRNVSDRRLLDLRRMPGMPLPGIDKPAAPPIRIQQRPKVNPFGAAKPVDVVAKEKEMEDKIIPINKTTVKTVGSLEEKTERATSPPSEKATSQRAPSSQSQKSEPVLRSAPAPTSTPWGKANGSIAEILGSRPDSGRSTPAKSPKEASAKPVILKKKVKEETKEAEAPKAELSVKVPEVEAQAKEEHEEKEKKEEKKDGESHKKKDEKTEPSGDVDAVLSPPSSTGAVDGALEPPASQESEPPINGKHKRDRPRGKSPSKLLHRAKISELNNSGAEDRPNFKQQFDEITLKKRPDDKRARRKLRSEGERAVPKKDARAPVKTAADESTNWRARPDKGELLNWRSAKNGGKVRADVNGLDFRKPKEGDGSRKPRDRDPRKDFPDVERSRKPKRDSVKHEGAGKAGFKDGRRSAPESQDSGEVADTSEGDPQEVGAPRDVKDRSRGRGRGKRSPEADVSSRSQLRQPKPRSKGASRPRSAKGTKETPSKLVSPGKEPKLVSPSKQASPQKEPSQASPEEASEPPKTPIDKSEGEASVPAPRERRGRGRGRGAHRGRGRGRGRGRPVADEV